jgi:hypothetical protein
LTAALRRDGKKAQAASPALLQEPVMSAHSTVGRPRRLTDAEVSWILHEHARYQAWRALRITVRSHRQLAAVLGVSPGTVILAIRAQGRYKQPSPKR